MIGYEFEFFMQDAKTKEPITHEQFNKFHEELAKDGWRNGRDLLTGGITYSKKDGIKLTTDDSIYVFEINMPPKKTVNEADEELKRLFNYLNRILDKTYIEILGIGMFPNHVPKDYEYTCNKAFIRYITPRRYWKNRTLMHKIAACQYWIDVSKENLIEYVNLMNKLNGVCVALLGNSSFSENKQNKNLEERLIAWKEFVETPYKDDKKIIGIPDREYKDLLDYFNFCFKVPFYGIYESKGSDGHSYYLEDHSKTNEDYFFSDEIEIIQADCKRRIIKPDLENLYELIQKNMFFDCRAKFNFKENVKVEEFKKAYKSNNEKAIFEMFDKTFVECRFIASQNKDEFSIGAAFLAGLLENLEKTQELVRKKEYDYWKELRKRAIEKGLNFEIEDKHITEILNEFMLISEDGLKKRGFGEEKFLERAKEFISKKENPGQRKLRFLKESGMEKVLEDSLL